MIDFVKSLLLYSFAAVVALLVHSEIARLRGRVAGIDGPRGLPIFGNIPQLRRNASEQYRIWAEKYGAVYQVMLGSVAVVVVNSAEAAQRVFVRNSAATISRPMFYTFHKVCNFLGLSVQLLSV